MSDTTDIDRQLRKEDGVSVHYERKSNGEPGMYKRILEALIVSAVIALVVAVWNVTQTVTLLQAAQESQRRDLDRVERRLDTLEGRNMRGGPDALDK